MYVYVGYMENSGIPEYLKKRAGAEIKNNDFITCVYFKG